MKPLLVTSGEPAGIGPDLCLQLGACPWPVVILGDKVLLQQRAKDLGIQIVLHDYSPNTPFIQSSHDLMVLSLPCRVKSRAGELNPANAVYVLDMLRIATEKCLKGEFSALVTAPVNKAVINQAGIFFSGHTEFLAQMCQVESVVMMLACKAMKVALITTHLPLNAVASQLSQAKIYSVVTQLHTSLQNEFAIANPKIYIAGLNPHAGENGYLGREEIDIITPAIQTLKHKGIDVEGPFPADTLFTPAYLKEADVFVAMYHDQGLPVLKYAGFGSAVNITLGLPIIRTSVDHGTALELAGTGLAKTESLIAAVETAAEMAKVRAT